MCNGERHPSCAEHSSLLSQHRLGRFHLERSTRSYVACCRAVSLPVLLVEGRCYAHDSPGRVLPYALGSVQESKHHRVEWCDVHMISPLGYKCLEIDDPDMSEPWAGVLSLGCRPVATHRSAPRPAERRAQCHVFAIGNDVANQLEAYYSPTEFNNPAHRPHQPSILKSHAHQCVLSTPNTFLRIPELLDSARPCKPTRLHRPMIIVCSKTRTKHVVLSTVSRSSIRCVFAHSHYGRLSSISCRRQAHIAAECTHPLHELSSEHVTSDTRACATNTT